MTAMSRFPKTASRPGPSPEPTAEQHDHGSLWDCLTCSIYLEDPPPPATEPIGMPSSLVRRARVSSFCSDGQPQATGR